MSKGFFSLILVIIIAFSLSIIPQNDNLIDFGFIDSLLNQDDEPEVTEPVDPFVPEYEMTSQRSTAGDDPYLFELTLSSNEPERALRPILTVEVSKSGVLVATYAEEEVLIDSTDLSDETYNRLTLTLDLSKENLELNPGLYTVEILVEDGDYHPVSQHELNFIESYDYVGSSDTTPSGKMYLELWFLDQTYNYLIPVSRAVDSTDRLVRETINNQFEGPNEASGLQIGHIGPWSYSAHVGAGNVLEMNFHPADLVPYGIGSSAAMFAVDSIVYSMTAIPYVDKVLFLAEENPIEYEYFHGTVLDEPVGRLDWPVIHLAHLSETGKVFLNPMVTYDLSLEDVFDLSRGQLEALEKYGLDYMVKNSQVIFPVPADAVVNAFTVDGSTVTLDLSGDPLESLYGDFDRNYEMMVDALVYSYTSFDDINVVKVLIDGEAPSDYHGVDLSSPLRAKAHINLEP